MFRIAMLASILAMLMVGCTSKSTKVQTTAAQTSSSLHAGSVDNPNLGKIRHVVLFKFKDNATVAQIKAVEDAFRALPSKISQIRDFEWGTNISPEGLAQGYTHCFFLTFDNEKDRDAYLPHPDHKAFGKVLGPILDKVLVVDYKAQK